MVMRGKVYYCYTDITSVLQVHFGENAKNGNTWKHSQAGKPSGPLNHHISVLEIHLGPNPGQEPFWEPDFANLDAF